MWRWAVRLRCLQLQLANAAPRPRCASVDALAAGGTYSARPKQPLVRIRLRMTTQTKRNTHMQHGKESWRQAVRLRCLQLQLVNAAPRPGCASVDASAAGGTYCARPKQLLVRIRLRMTTQTKRNSHGSIVRSHVRLVPWKSHVNVGKAVGFRKKISGNLRPPQIPGPTKG